jgi:hypothetical protein
MGDRPKKRSGARAKALAIALAAALPMMGGGVFARYDGASESRLTPDQLLRNFELIVFHNEFDERVDTRLRKWTAPVKIYLDIRAGDRSTILNVMERHVHHLAQITGHDIHLVSDRNAANVAVVLERASQLAQVEHDYFKDGLDIRQVMQTNLCIGRYQSNSRFEIYRATVVIPVDRVVAQHRLTACLIEETTQILGLPNDSDSVVPSIFNDRSADIELTDQDILLVKLLYDRRLHAGEPRSDVLREVRDILLEVAPEGLIVRPASLSAPPP